MIATIEHIDEFSEMLCDELSKKLDELRYEIEDLSDPPKLAFIKYWKRIIGVINPYKEKCQTFAYVFIRPMVHIRTLFKLY